MKSDERISFEKIENGFLVIHTWEENKGKDYKYISKRFYTKTAKETKAKISELSDKMNIK